MSQIELDPQVLSRALGGDRKAFQQIVDQCWGVLYVFVHQRVSDAELARDLTQESLMQAYAKRETLESGASFLSWLLTIAARKIIDFHRRRGVRPETALDGEAETRIPDRSRTPESLSEERESQEELHRALPELDDRYRTVLILRYWSGMSPAQIARLLSEPEGTIRNRIFRAHAKLRDVIEERSRQSENSRENRGGAHVA